MYYYNEAKYKISKKDELILKKLDLKESDILFYYDIPLMFILSSEENKEIKFLAYMFSSIDDNIWKYYILEKTNNEIDQYINGKIDLYTFLNTDIHERICCVENFDKKTGKVEVLYLNEDDLKNTLTLIKKDLFYRK